MFITFEGVDACGKSSIILALKEHIAKKYDINQFVFTREPGGTNLNVSERIRELILDNKSKIDPLSEALLYLSSRSIHIQQLIQPALEQKKIVICDRFIDSSIVYQGNARNLGMDKIEKLNLMVANNTLPQYTFYLKIDAKTSLERMQKENRNFDRMESEGETFFQKVIEGYDYLQKRDHHRFIVIDASKNLDDVLKDVIKIFDKILSTQN